MATRPSITRRSSGQRSESAFINATRAGIAAVSLSLSASCAEPPRGGPARADLDVVDRGAHPRPPFEFDRDDGAFLDQVQRGAFRYLWEVADPATGMVFDRTSVRVISVAGVGFQLGAIPVGVERGWITRDQGAERAALILSSLEGQPANRRHGLFFHYLDEGTGAPSSKGYETVVSTIDSAILIAGMITASSYFGGAVAERADRMIGAADWRAFVAADPPEDWARGFITLGWRAADPRAPGGEGALLPYYWADAGDEQKLVTFLAVGADASKGVDPSVYYRLRRRLGGYKDSGPFVWFPWSGAMFTHFFAHCWIGYAAMGPDDPSRFGVERRPRVDWWENSRRAAVMQRAKARDNPRGLPAFAAGAWGLGANDEAGGYAVRDLYPDAVEFPGAREGVDFADAKVKDDWGDGTVAPYNAGCAIMFTPRESLAALHLYAAAADPAGRPLAWRDPREGGMGFQDAFNPATSWTAPDCVAIDQGPLLLCIENARTGLIWRLFHAHPAVRSACDRLGLHFKPEPRDR